LLEINDLYRRFGDHEVLRGFNLCVYRGERVALRGPNGSGKTTILRCVAGTLTPTSGTITVDGHGAGSLDARQLIGTSLSQERSFYLRLSGRANLLFFARLRGYRDRETAQLVRALEEELGLQEILAQRVDRCSTGMVQQLAFARALLADPPLLLLDEPTRSLDTDAVAHLWNALDRRRDAAILLATHLPDDVDRCDRELELTRAAA
jgi:ABC-type multidrug transport system ATPase subunit